MAVWADKSQAINNWKDKPDSNIIIDGELNIVVIGASIMHSLVNTSSERQQLGDDFASNGIVATAYDRATGGFTTTDLLAELPATLLEFKGQEANTIFPLHIGGNNLTQNGAYPAANPTLVTEWREIVQMIIDAGFVVVPSPISYRDSVDSVPYNVNDLIPIIQELTPKWITGSSAFFDLYQLIFNNRDWLTDGTHLDSTGQDLTRKYMAKQISDNITQVNVPVIILPPTSAIMSDVVIDLGSEENPDIFNKVESSGTLTDLRDIDGTIVLGSSFTFESAGGASNTGRGNAGDTSTSLTNDILLTNFIFNGSSGTKTITINVGDFVPADTFTIKITASRDTTAIDRITEYTIDGVTLEIDAANNPPLIVEFNNVTGQELLDNGIQWNKKAGSSFGYINGIRIIKE